MHQVNKRTPVDDPNIITLAMLPRQKQSKTAHDHGLSRRIYTEGRATVSQLYALSVRVANGSARSRSL